MFGDDQVDLILDSGVVVHEVGGVREVAGTHHVPVHTALEVGFLGAERCGQQRYETNNGEGDEATHDATPAGPFNVGAARSSVRAQPALRPQEVSRYVAEPRADPVRVTASSPSPG